MIKKKLRAIFQDGPYEGNYEWTGGIPMSEGERINVRLGDKVVEYVLEKKTVDLEVREDDQEVFVVYKFRRQH